jgi:hypothetical protein
MQRYFMTIPEAVQLIIRSGSLSERSGEVFVLEMGEPVLIVDLAKAMIRLSGYEPDRDIAIEVVGAKPGEKLHEELFNSYESRSRPRPRRSCARPSAARPRLVQRTFDEVNLFVLEDDAAALAAKVSELSAVRTAAPGGGAPRSADAGPPSGYPRRTPDACVGSPLAVIFAFQSTASGRSRDVASPRRSGLPCSRCCCSPGARAEATARWGAHAPDRIGELEARPPPPWSWPAT